VITATAGPAEELADRITAAGYRVRQLTTFAGDQRQRSWRIAVHGGPALWAKVERECSPFAGVRQEAAALERLAGLGPVPEIVTHGELSSGAAYLVTVEAPGQPLTGAMFRLAGTANAAAAVLGEFGALAGTGAGPCYPGRHVFARHPDLAMLLEPASGWLDAVALLVPALRAGLRRGFPGETARLVHGSFHPGNALVTPAGTVTIIDLEATRIGLASFDVAAMAGGLLSEGSVAAARTWLAEAIPALGLPAENVAGFLALRAWHRYQAGALTTGEREAVAGLLPLLFQIVYTAEP
jgi:aminoglycoside phosphotransferase (APT) family kinase protein